MPRTNDVIGTWKLGKKLGEGGQGSVWEVRSAKDNRAPPRAMKISFAASDKDRARFENEIKALVGIDHAHVIKVLDHDASWTIESNEGPLAFYVTERCSELSHLVLLREAPGAALVLVRQALEAIAHIHGLPTPILHRDIKPANILVASEPVRLLVGDFGIATAAAVGDVKLTGTQEVVGTPYYRAPEVLHGEPATIRSDIYSLGRTLQWIFTGQDPDLKDPRPVDRSNMSPQLAERLDTVIRRACADQPEARYASVRELIADLPDVWADIRDDGSRVSDGDSVALGTSVGAVGSYRAAVEVIQARDEVAWRRIQKRRRSELAERLHAWRQKHEQGWSQVTNHEALLDELLDSTAHLLVRTMAATEFGFGLAEPTALLRDILAVPQWSRAGLTKIVDYPLTLAYVAHNLCGAAGVAGGRIADVLDMILSPVRSAERSNAGDQPLLKEPYMIAWPGGLPDARSAWRYAIGLGSRPWVAEVFASGYDYQVALVGYWWTLTVVELGTTLKVQNPDQPLAEPGLMLDVPPVFMAEERDLMDRAFATAFPSANAVEVVARKLGVGSERLRASWEPWGNILKARLPQSDGASYRARNREISPLP